MLVYQMDFGQHEDVLWWQTSKPHLHSQLNQSFYKAPYGKQKDFLCPWQPKFPSVHQYELLTSDFCYTEILQAQIVHGSQMDTMDLCQPEQLVVEDLHYWEAYCH